MDEEILEETLPGEENDNDRGYMDRPVVPDDEEVFGYSYPIYDQSNQLITDPDLTLGYLKKEYFTTYHEAIPEKWHYEVILFEFANGEQYKPTSNADPHVNIVDAQKGIFSYVNLDGEEERIVTGQTITPVEDSPYVPGWEETNTIYRYVLYTEKELADREFLTNGPTLLAEAQETIDDLLLVIADLLGGGEEEPVEE